jgi:hypothetical protein
MNRRKYILFVLPAVFVLFCLGIYLLYLKNVSIYEPVTIKISGLSAKECRQIELFGISPLNKKCRIPYIDSLNAWFYYYAYHKAIGTIIPDSVYRKINQVDIRIGKTKTMISAGKLICIDSSSTAGEYRFPAQMYPGKSIIKMVISVFHWYLVQLIIKILLLLFAFFLIIFNIRKIRDFLIRLCKLSKIIFRFIYRMIKTVSGFLYESIIKTGRMLYKLMKRGINLFRGIIIFLRNNINLVIKWVIIIVSSVVAAFGIFYMYLLFRFFIATYITTLFFIFFTGITIWLTAILVLRVFRVSRKSSSCVKKWVICFVIMLFAMESLLRLFHVNMTYNEKSGFYYASGFKNNVADVQSDPQLFIHPSNKRFIDRRKESAYEFSCNKEGLRDRDHNIVKEKDEYRIICLGNSWTEGIGTPGDSTWPRLLEDKLRISSKKKISVFNAGKSGSDPFFEYMLLKKRMLKYHPDLVILSLVPSDFEFYRYRGGFERFTKTGLKLRNGPKWERLYAVSYIFRFFNDDVFNYKKFLTPSEAHEDYNKALTDINQCLNRFNETAKENSFGLLVVFINDLNGKYLPLIQKIERSKIIPFLNMNDYLSQEEKISDKDLDLYRWPIDGHYNSRGYDLLARGVYWKLKQMGVIDTAGNCKLRITN